MVKTFLIVGTRPNFIKIALLQKEMIKSKYFTPFIVHTGQHYDYEMSKVFFKGLNIPNPDINLDVGSGTHGEQIGRTIIELEKACFREKPDLMIVVGDVNSTLAGALVASKLHIPLAHIEAGLRSFDNTMPEEINRRVTDQLSDFLFTPHKEGNKNLIKEGISNDKIFEVGDIMIDTLFTNQKKINSIKKYKDYGVEPKKYALLTLHRDSNVDNETILEIILSTINVISAKIPVIFPVHPRTKKRIEEFGFEKYVTKIKLVPPLGYIEFHSLLGNAKFIFTDSGGIQEETMVLNIPCITLRENTERPYTITDGTNTLVGSDIVKIYRSVGRILNGDAQLSLCCFTIDCFKKGLKRQTTSNKIVKILKEII